jgi:NADH-quinone oxidoreductase subunit L
VGVLVTSPWLAVVVPMLLATLVAGVGARGRRVAPWLSMIGPIAVTLVGIAGITTARVLGEMRGAVVSAGGYEWFRVGQTVIRLGWTVDRLGAVMLVVVGVVAFLVMLFSVGYMAHDEGYVRYFALLSLFTASMSLLVIADGFVSLFAGWELVGACSYLLIGFWYRKPSAAAAAIKAFLVTRVGDVGLLVGIAILWAGTGGVTYVAVFERMGALSATALTAAAVLIAIGAMGKSAQFPLHIWLPDAMEGPTPVSALIHAATMVAAGVFLVARTWPIFEASPVARAVLLAAGLISALGAATAAVAQTDIKKVLAYSTISQLGFMFVALGCGAWVAAFFHLVTHAAFKALLFLGSGSVIHGTDTQEIREMGGLRRVMPITFVTWVVGSLALAGVWPLAGFFSKDEILSAGFATSPFVGITLVATAGVTAFYIARTTRLVFFGDYRGEGRPHEGPWTMTAPLVVLAVLAAVLGLAATGLARLLAETPAGIDPAIAVPALAVTLAGLVGGWFVVGHGASSDERLEATLGRLWPAMRSAWGWNALVTGPLVSGLVAAVRVTYAFVDRLLIDGIVEGAAIVTRKAGSGLANLQSGNLSAYAVLVVLGAFFLISGLFNGTLLLIGFGAVVVAAVVASVGK